MTAGISSLTASHDLVTGCLTPPCGKSRKVQKTGPNALDSALTHHRFRPTPAHESSLKGGTVDPLTGNLPQPSRKRQRESKRSTHVKMRTEHAAAAAAEKSEPSRAEVGGDLKTTAKEHAAADITAVLAAAIQRGTSCQPRSSGDGFRRWLEEKRLTGDSMRS